MPRFDQPIEPMTLGNMRELGFELEARPIQPSHKIRRSKPLDGAIAIDHLGALQGSAGQEEPLGRRSAVIQIDSALPV
jgi:hypothetical protein